MLDDERRAPRAGRLMAGRRRFGNLRKRALGRWQARYLGPDGLMHSAPNTFFATERDGAQWLTPMESEIIRGEWQAPEAGEVVLSAYGDRWIADRKLAPRTRQGYEYLLALHIGPHHGAAGSRRGQAGHDPGVAAPLHRRRHSRAAGRQGVRPAPGHFQYRDEGGRDHPAEPVLDQRL